MIRIEGLHKSFGDKVVLDGASLQVNKGESMVVIGGSGTGKSVLLKHIVRLLEPDSGNVFVEGVDISTLNTKELYDIRKRIGLVFQEAALFDSMNVWENVGFTYLRAKKMTDTDIKEHAVETLKLVGLSNVEDLMPSQLSGGMRRRVGLARVLSYKPDIILYDEPTTGLDPIMADAVNELIIEMREKLSVTSVTITHDMASAYKIADRISMLYLGKVVQTGTPDEIKHTDNPVVRQFVTGSAVGPIKIEGVTRTG